MRFSIRVLIRYVEQSIVVRRAFRDYSQVYLESNFTSADYAEAFGEEFSDSVPAKGEDCQLISTN